MKVFRSRAGLNGWLSAGLIGFALCIGGFAWLDYTQAEVAVEWTTASELSTVGFNLYRSDLVDGEYIKMSNELIPASPDPLTGGKYSYIDDQVIAGSTYYYELEEVEFDGSTSRYGPIEVQAKRSSSIALLLSMILLAIGVSGMFLAIKRKHGKDELPSG